MEGHGSTKAISTVSLACSKFFSELRWAHGLRFVPFSQVGFFAFNGFCVHDIHHGVGLCENKTQASIRHMHGCAQKFIVFHRAVSTGNVRVAIAEPRYSRLQGGNVVVRYFESQHSTAGENPTPCSNHIAEEEPAFVKRRILGYNTCFLCQWCLKSLGMLFGHSWGHSTNKACPLGNRYTEVVSCGKTLLQSHFLEHRHPGIEARLGFFLFDYFVDFGLRQKKDSAVPTAEHSSWRYLRWCDFPMHSGHIMTYLKDRDTE